MNLSWFLGKPDPLLLQAKTLVYAANVMGVSSYTQFATDLPIVKNIDMEQWDWVFTVAGVFLADRHLCTGDLETTRKQKLHGILIEELTAWKPDGVAGLHDCNTLYERTYERLSVMDEYKSDRRFLGSDSLGTWMAWNLLGHAPQSEEERKLGRMAGAFVAHAFSDWWETT